MSINELNELCKRIYETLGKSFCVIEDNAGGLTLVVYSRNDAGVNIDYLHTGYEYYPGSLLEDLKKMANGEDPVCDWDGNVENPSKVFDSFVDFLGCGCEVIVDNDGVDPKSIGMSGRKEFGIRWE